MKYKYKEVQNRQRIYNHVLILYIKCAWLRKPFEFNIKVIVFYAIGIYFNSIGKIVFKENLDAKLEILFTSFCTKCRPKDDAVP